MIASRDRVRHFAATVGAIAPILPLGVVLLSVAFAPASNWTVRIALAGFCILAISRPDLALLVTTALLGFGTILSLFAGVPSLRVTELLVVASLFGCCVRALPAGGSFRRALTGWVSVPIVLFAVAAVASATVWQRVYQFQTGYAATYFQALLHFVSHDYFVEPGDFWGLVSTAVILEGLGLYIAMAALCQVDETFFERALRMLVAGGVGLGVLSGVRLAEILLRNPGAIEAMRATSNGLRISPQIPDYIAAGSYFALCWVAALGIALARPGRRIVWLAASGPVIAALYLTGSRSVIAAAAVGLVALLLVVLRRKAPTARSVVAFAVLAVAVMVLSYRWMSGRDVAGEMARQSLTVRAELIRAGLRVIGTRPVFGVGIDHFYLVAGPLASPTLRALWGGRMNPHNDFLRFGGELGLVGLGLFLWILIAAGKRVWEALRTTHDAQLGGLAGGLVAFLVTSLVSNPLMVREVSYVFWIALGLGVGNAARLRASHRMSEVVPSESTGPLRRFSGWRRPVAGLLGTLLVVSIPSRAGKELAAVDLTRVSYGFYGWGTERDGTPARWSGPRATFFVDGRAQLIEIPVSTATPPDVVQHAEVRVDGRVANRVVVGLAWQRLRILLPGGPSTGPHRVDLIVSPPWIPAEVVPGSEDRRLLGVKVGVIRVILAPGSSSQADQIGPG
jgi:uncharacterized membrane protein